MKKKLLAILGALTLGVGVIHGVPTVPAMAANCDPSFLGFQAWYSGLAMDSNCNIDSSKYKDKDGLSKLIWTIVLNIMLDISIAVGILATGFVMYGGYLYIMSRGEPDKTAKGKITIRNAAIGIIIAVGAGVIVGTIKTILTA